MNFFVVFDLIESSFFAFIFKFFELVVNCYLGKMYLYYLGWCLNFYCNGWFVFLIINLMFWIWTCLFGILSLLMSILPCSLMRFNLKFVNFEMILFSLQRRRGIVLVFFSDNFCWYVSVNFLEVDEVNIVF